MNIEKRLQRAEEMAKQLRPDFPNNDDGFLDALGVDAEQFRRGGGYDVLCALDATAADDWADYVKLP